MSQPLTYDQLQELAPSVFAEHPWKNVSSRYAFLPTIKVINALAANGIYPYSARQSATRIEGKQPYTKHMLRFRDNILLKTVGDTLPEVVLTNSHDRGSSFHIEVGLYRLVCSNGMVVSAGNFDSYHVIHVKNTIENVLESVHKITCQFPKLLETVSHFKTVELSIDQREHMAKMALGLRYDPDKFPFNPKRLLETRRPVDQGTDLWSVYNVIQENLLRGQTRRRYVPWYTTRERSSREIRSIDTDLTLNKGLWKLASNLA